MTRLFLAAALAVSAGDREIDVLSQVPHAPITVVAAPHAPIPPPHGTPAETLPYPLENDGTFGATDADIDARSAWEITTGDASVIVAILDTGVDVTHPQLASSVWTNTAELNGTPGFDDDGDGLIDDVHGWDFNGNDPDVLDAGFPHGTLVAGLISGTQTGLAPGVTILPLKIFDDSGAGGANFEQNAADAIHFAILKGARIIQISWELSGPPGAVLDQAFADADAADVLVVAAAGNNGINLTLSPQYPVSLAYTNVIGVAGTDRYDRPVNLPGDFVTNFGVVWVELAAPTEKSLTTFPGGGNILFTGTSASAPLVSAAAALALSANPAMTTTQLKSALVTGANRLPALEAIALGSGRLNAGNTVRLALDASLASPRALTGAIDRGDPDRALVFDGSRSFTASGSNGEPALAGRWAFGDGDAAGTLVAEHTYREGGDFIASLQVTDASGLTHVERRTVSIPMRTAPVATLVETAHPYAAGTQLAFPISVPGAAFFRLHFSKIDTAGNDAVLTFDGARIGLHGYQGSLTDVTTDPIRGDFAFIVIRGFTGGTYGFTLDRIDVELAGQSEHPPEAQVDGPITVTLGATAALSAAGSTDADGDPLSYAWRIVQAPSGSTATLTQSSGATVSLTPDRLGSWAIALSVSDGFQTRSRLAWVVARGVDDHGFNCSVTPSSRAAPLVPLLVALLVALAFRRARAAIVVAMLGAGCVHAPPTGDRPPVIEKARAADGWQLALRRYPIPDGVEHRPLPVILCHGLGSNHVSLDLDEGGSLARALAAQGLDVWSLDLRNHGDSAARPAGGETRGEVSFDDYVRLDAPAAIAFVRERTGAPGVVWVGHSMGGIVAYAYTGRGGGGIEDLVAIASPGNVREEGGVKAIAGLARITAFLPQLHARNYMRAHAAIFRGWSEWHLDEYVFMRENLTARERTLLNGTAVENLSRGEIRQFRRWMTDHTFDSNDHKDDYAANLANIRVPVLLVSASADALVPPPNVQFVMDRLGSADKTHRLFGKSEGDAHDFGHVDIAAGQLAAKEIFPTIAEWILAHDKSAPPARSVE